MTRATIAQVLAMLAFRCPGRDPLAEISKGLDDIKKDPAGKTEADRARESMMLFWLDQLKDLEESILLAATRDLCGAPGQWNPSVGDIRQRAVELSLGHLAPPSVGEAWGRVVEWAKGEPIQLMDAEKAAAKRAGGTWELKHSENVTTTRAHFIRFYEEEVKKLVMTRRAHPETRELADHNRPALPEHREAVFGNPRQLYVSEVTTATPQQVKELLKGYKGYENANDRATDRTDNGDTQGVKREDGHYRSESASTQISTGWNGSRDRGQGGEPGSVDGGHQVEHGADCSASGGQR